MLIYAPVHKTGIVDRKTDLKNAGGFVFCHATFLIWRYPWNDSGLRPTSPMVPVDQSQGVDARTASGSAQRESKEAAA
jgi:hypothetical protein